MSVLAPPDVPGERFVPLPQRIRANAAARPGAVALVDGDERLTWHDLAARMDAVAGNLAAAGMRPGDVAASLAGVTADHVALYLGVIAAGGAMAPLPLTAHPDALARMIRNSGAERVFGDDAAPEVPGLVQMPRGGAPAPEVVHAPDDLFDVIYSSGTTGDPKGVEHDALFRHRQVERFSGFGFGEASVTLISTPICSNTTLVALIPALALGGTVVLQRRFDEAAWLALAEAHRVTHAMLVPVQIRRLLEHPAFDRTDLTAFSVKLTTSAPFPAPLARAALDRWPGRMISIYGMTEGGVSAVLDCGAHPDKLRTVGRAAAHAEIRIVGEDGRAVRAGEAGEVMGRAPATMRGYRGAPEATARVLWISPEGSPFLRTGDMGRLDDEGFLTLLDRRKDMIVSGGFNVYAADVEEVLMTHPAVSDAAVFGVPSERWGEAPAACIVLRAGASEEEVLAWANARLGRTQRLSALRAVPALPRSEVGKVLKRQLREEWADV